MENSLRFSLKVISVLVSSWMPGVRAVRAAERECASETSSVKSSWSSPRLWPPFLTRYEDACLALKPAYKVRRYPSISKTRSEMGGLFWLSHPIYSSSALWILAL